MKVNRPLLIGLAAVAVMLLAAVVTLFTPAFQRWAVLRAVRGQPGLELEVDRVAAGLGRLELAGLRLRQSGVAVRIERASGDYRLWPLLTGRRLELDKLTARGVSIDASRLDASATSATAAAPAAAPGALGRMELPYELVLGACEIEGDALLPGATEGAPVQATFRVTGGGLAPGREGTLQLRATLTNPSPAARVGTLRSEVTLRVTQSQVRTFSKVTLVGSVDAEGRGLNGPTQLKLAAAFASGTDGETYTAKVDSVTGGQAGNILAVQAALPAGGDAFAGTWEIRARTAQVEAFYLGGELPEFEASGAGRFTLAPARADLAVQGSLEVSAHAFERIDPALRAVGAVRLQGRFDLAKEKGVARLNQLQASLAGTQPVLEIEAVQSVAVDLGTGRVQLGGDGGGDVARVRLIGVPLAWIRPFVTAVDVSGGLLTGDIAVRAERGKLIAASTVPLRVDPLNIVRNGEALLAKAALTAEVQAELAAGQWSARLQQLQVRTAEGDELAAQLNLAAEQAGSAQQIALIGSYQARLPTMLRPAVDGLQVQAEGEVDVALTGTQVRIAKLTSRVRTLDGQPVLSTEVRQPFTYSTDTQAITSSGADAELMRVEMGRIALAPLLGGLVTGLAGSVTQGSFALEAENGGWRLRPVAPIVVSALEMSQNGQPTLGGLTVQFAPLLAMSAAGELKAQLGDVALRTADGASLATWQADVAHGTAGLRAAGSFQVELPALARLPAFAGASPLAQGRAAGEIRAARDAQGEQLEARVTINGLVAPGQGSPLPVANISLRLTRQLDGGMKVEVPVLLDRAGVRSDMNFSATLNRGGTGHLLKAKLTGGRAALEDLLAVVAVFSVAANESAAPPAGRTNAAPIVADRAPPWARLSGEVGLDFKSVSYGQDWTATDLRGTLQIEPNRVSLPIVEAGFGEKGRFEAHGELVFEPRARPYQLGGGFTLSEFDAGPFFQAIDPARPPTVEGRFNVEGRFDGDGRTFGETMELTRGTFQLTSRQGVFRGLKRGTEKVSVATRAVELGAALGSLFGSDKMRGAAEKVAGGAYFADQLAQEFGELKYDQLNVRLERGESLDLKLSEVALISPEVRLVGQGTVTYVEGRPLLDQPLNVELALGARGKVESLLGRANLLVGPLAKDDLGYARSRYPLVIAGSMAKPDALSFYTRLATSRLLDSLAPEN